MLHKGAYELRAKNNLTSELELLKLFPRAVGLMKRLQEVERLMSENYLSIEQAQELKIICNFELFLGTDKHF